MFTDSGGPPELLQCDWKFNMTEEEARIAIRTTFSVLARVAAKTRTQADDLMLQMLQANETKLVSAVHSLANDSVQPPSAERVSAALAQVGIRA